MNTNNLTYPENVGYIIDKINEEGFEAFVVGGCVRDLILGRTPNDWDITTNALPDEIKSIFDKTYDTGIKHGTVSVAVDECIFELTTYRVDGQYTDSRRPDSVSFTSSLKEDLARRDFTINAMAYNSQIGLVDYFDGVKDLERRIIRTVGAPGLRFSEDALRMLRAVRFSSQLGFSIEKETLQAIDENAASIRSISSERVRDELTRILISQRPEGFNLLYKSGLLKYVMPDFTPCYITEQNNPYHIYNVADHTMKTVQSVQDNKILRWTMLLHDIGKPARKTTDTAGIDHFYGHQEVSARMSERILNNLRFDKATIKKILTLVKYHDIDIFDTERSVRKAINKVGEELFVYLLEVQKADAMGQNPVYLDKRLIKLDNIKKIYKDIKEKKQCLTMSEMAINGDDLIALGMKPGREMKELLNYLFDTVLENPEVNNREVLLELARQRISELPCQ